MHDILFIFDTFSSSLTLLLCAWDKDIMFTQPLPFPSHKLTTNISAVQLCISLQQPLKFALMHLREVLPKFTHAERAPNTHAGGSFWFWLQVSPALLTRSLCAPHQVASMGSTRKQSWSGASGDLLGTCYAHPTVLGSLGELNMLRLVPITCHCCFLIDSWLGIHGEWSTFHLQCQRLPAECPLCLEAV